MLEAGNVSLMKKGSELRTELVTGMMRRVLPLLR